MLFKDISYLKSSLCPFVLHNYMYFEFEPVVQEMSFKDISYLGLCRPLCLAEPNHLSNFGRGHHKEHFCEIILNLDQ